MLSYFRRVPACKLLFIAGCLYMILSGRYPPPSSAQEPAIPSVASTASAEVYGLEVRAAGETARVDALAADIGKVEGQQSKMAEDIGEAKVTIAHMSGEQAAIGATLALLQLWGMFRDSRKKGAL
jgi:hypothetical protein